MLVRDWTNVYVCMWYVRALVSDLEELAGVLDVAYLFVTCTCRLIC
jgi:hypothetical protein